MFSGRIGGVGSFTITPLDLGRLTVPPGTPMGGTVLPVQAFLVKHPNGLLLFDTGLGAEHAAFDRLLSPVRRPLDEVLAAANVRLTEVQAVINCHLHYDHAGGNPLFPQTPIFVEAREYEMARELAYVIPDRIDFAGADLRLLHGETEIAPGIRAVPTPGHTPGHQSVVIEEKGGPVVLAGQAAYTVAEFVDPEREPARGLKTAYNGAQFLESLGCLRAIEPQRVYFSHDERVWESRPDLDPSGLTLHP